MGAPLAMFTAERNTVYLKLSTVVLDRSPWWTQHSVGPRSSFTPANELFRSFAPLLPPFPPLFHNLFLLLRHNCPFLHPALPKGGRRGGGNYGGEIRLFPPQKLGTLLLPTLCCRSATPIPPPLPPLPPFRPEQHALFDERLPHLSFRALRTSLCAFERSRLSGAPVSLELQEMLRKTETLQVKTVGNHSI